MSACAADGCTTPKVKARGLCKKHYERFLAERGPWTPERRFWSRVDKDGPVPLHRPDLGQCWIWTGLRTAGYGQIQIAREKIGTHRVSYTWLVGPIPEGLHIDHLCRVQLCVNPAHLEPVTPRENCHRGFSPTALNRLKTHCPQGHPYDEENTYWDRKGRQCRACNLARGRARYWRRKAAGLPATKRELRLAAERHNDRRAA